jgi:uncharacterized beta barrel domain-containing protein DUF5777
MAGARGGTPLAIITGDYMTRLLLRALGAAFMFTALVVAPCQAQAPDPASPPTAPPEIELNLINLPTTMSLRKHHSYFRLTHRFARDLRRGSLGQLAEDLFSLDNGAIIGLEYRFGITTDLQAGVHRSLLSRTIQVFGKYDGWHQRDGLPVSVSLVASIEGLDNLQENHQPAVVATISRAFDNWLVVYASPGFVGNTRAADFLTGHDHDLPGAEADEHAEHKHTVFLGLGGRARLRPSVFVTGEYTPRLAGHDPGRGTWGMAIEKRTRGGGHTLQLNVTNSFGTTFGQLARGGSEHDIYLGFNITRRF